jgi:hypothetical protein
MPSWWRRGWRASTKEGVADENEETYARVRTFLEAIASHETRIVETDQGVYWMCAGIILFV